MSVLNTASDGYFNVLIVLFRTLYAFGPMPRERLLKLCTVGPNSDTQRLVQTLNRWTELGLFVSDNDTISLLEDLQPPHRKALEQLDKATRDLPKTLRRLVFQPHNNERFWDHEKTRCADLTRGLAWLLTQDIYSAKLWTAEDAQQLESNQILDQDYLMLQNDVRWRGLRAWARYLGFVWKLDVIMIDPTVAIRQDLPLVFEGVKELPAAEFVERLATAIPVLDGGRYRQIVESKLNEAHWLRVQQSDLLSTSLSRALWRLHSARVLFFEARADAGDSRVMQRRGGEEWLRFTHVRYTEGTT